MTTRRWSGSRSPTTLARSPSCAAYSRASPHNHRIPAVVRMRRRAMRTHRISVVVLGTVALVVSTCGGGQPTTQPSGSAAPKQDIKVGVAISLTGAANVYGPSQQNGVNLAAGEINAAGGVNGSKIQLLIEDDASTAQQSITVFNKFIEQDKVAAILGPTLSGSAAGAHPVAQKGQTPTIAISNTGIGIVGKCDYGPCDYIFRASLGEETALPATVKAAKAALNLKKVVLLYAQDDKFSADDGTIFQKALAAEGIQITKTITFSKSDVDFAGTVGIAKNENPDALVVALKRASDPMDHAALKKALEGVQPLKTPPGGFSFNADHDVSQNVYVMTIKGNAFVPFK